MTQDRVSLPEGAGALAGSNDRSSTGTTGTTGTSGTTGTTGTTGSTGSTGSQGTTTTSYSGSTSSSTTPERTDHRSGGEIGYYDESRELVVQERSRKPSTATVVGAAIAGAIAGGAIPFMLSGRSSSSRTRSESETVQESLIINRPAREIYDFWRDFTNFPQFMDNIQSVDKLDDRRSHWVIKAPAGTSVEFDSYIVEDIPGRLISWRSEEGASVPNRGRVEFIETSSGTGTNVRTTISYDPPAGTAGRLVAKLFQREPSVQARQDLQNLKQLLENRGR